MKRPIHFRAWFVAGPNEEIKTMFEGVTVYDSGNIGMNDEDFVNEITEQTGFTREDDELFVKDGVEIDLTLFNCYNGEDWMHFEGELMQLTGLKDSEGNNIWEDDIIEYTFKDDDQKELAQVVFEEGAWCSKSLNGSPEYLWEELQSTAFSSVRVVGNVHQNSDLLK